MAGSQTVQEVVQSLETRGDARGEMRWPDGDPDYVTEYSLTAEHIPALIGLATKWVDEHPDNDAVYAPVHAWRALGQLRAVEAVQPLLDVQDVLDKIDDDWYLVRYVEK